MSNATLPRALPSAVEPHPASRGRTTLWSIYVVLGLFFAGYLVSLLLRSQGQYWTWLDGWATCTAELVASSLCISRFFLRRGSGAKPQVALVLGFALLSWTAGDIALTIESLGGASPPTPSVADVFYLGFYPLAYTAVLMFLRREMRRLGTTGLLDGAIAGLGAAAACAAFAFHDVRKSTGGNPPATVTNLAYPIGDVLLLGLVVGSMAVLWGRRSSGWALLACGMALNVVGDTSNLFQNSLGASRFGFILNAIAWPSAIVLMSLAVWLRQRPADFVTRPRFAGFLLPNVAAAAALAVLVVGTVRPVGDVAVALATLTLLAVGVRLAVSVRAIQTTSRERHAQSITDDLTGLGNRRYLFTVLEAFFADQRENDSGRTLAFLFVDLNHFKEINDSFGHPAGDQLLKQLGARLSTSLRDTDLVVRLGGDEFAVVLVDGELDHAMRVAERLTASLREPFQLDVVNAKISASIGIAVAPADAGDPAGLMWCADVAMYRAKLSSKPFACYEEDVDLDGDHMRLLEELRGAIDAGELVLHYQPQLDLKSGQILGVEALIRWVHPRLGLLAPYKFLPLAEDAGLMPSITTWVLEEAAAQAGVWQAAGRQVSIAVNVSPSTLLEPGFVSLVRDTLSQHRLPVSALVIEITETYVISELGVARQVIEELRAVGVVVSIDDFGAGATSLAYLGSLPVRELKLDRSFIAALAAGDTDRDLDLVRSTIDLGHAMGLRIVAEGIEDEETLRMLSKLGCDLAQGYCIGKPKPAAELAFRFEASDAAA